MSETILKQRKRPGRPKRPGTMAFDSHGRMCVFVGYCDHGDKVLIDRDDIDPLVRWARKERKRPIIRLMERFIKSRTL